MPRSQKPVPSYRLHKQSGQAVTTLRDAAGRRDVLLGPYDSPESRAEYERVLSLLRIGRMPWGDADPAAGLTVAEFLLPYRRHAQTYYANAKVRDNVRLPAPRRGDWGQSRPPLPLLHHTPRPHLTGRALQISPGRSAGSRRLGKTAQGPAQRL
jgi:hypothetical protein